MSLTFWQVDLRFGILTLFVCIFLFCVVVLVVTSNEEKFV